MLGLYIDEQDHADIKHAAERKGMSMKDYLLELHRKEFQFGPQTDVEDRLNRIEAKLGVLIDHFAKASTTSTPTSIEKSQQPLPAAQERSQPIAPPVTKASADISVYEPYFQQILQKKPRKRPAVEAARELLQILLKHGGAAPREVFEEELGQRADRPIEVLIGEIKGVNIQGIAFKDKSHSPYLLTLRGI